MYQTFIAKIKTTLEKVGSVRKIYNYPVTKVAQYPAVIYLPDSTENSYSSVANNREVVRFRAFVVVGTEGIQDETIFATVLPKVTDDIIKQFNEDWDGGNVDGSRVWLVVESGLWTVSTNQRGTEAVAELVITFNVDRDIT